MRRRPRVIVYLILGCLSLASLVYLVLIRSVEEDGRPTAGKFHGRRLKPPTSIHEKLQDLEDKLEESKNSIKDARLRVIEASRRQKQETLEEESNSPNIQSNTCSFDSLERNSNVVSLQDIYESIPFDNRDGGVWKQGWDIQVNSSRKNGKKLQVFVVPHSHNDPGWLKTFEGYFRGHTKHILDNMLKFLTDHPSMKFIWAETSYFAFWWETVSSSEEKEQVKRLLNNGQLEIVTGGWVMNDEASTHIFAMISQLVEGHDWLMQHLNYTPRHGWAIDPFGLSPSMAFLLERSGFDGMVIQRVHYSVKKYMAENHLLEFKWRQNWQSKNLEGVSRRKDSGITCHVMPFYSYDIPHSCGPDPKVCCQYDFRRLPPFKLNCPWKINPSPITEYNVEDKARKLADQYWKKAMLFKTNTVLIPLGDDFRYEKLKEWDLQYDNYQKLFDYMNTAPDLNMEAKFATLADYFDYIRQEHEIESSPLPSLTGDFFTYSDRDDHYWSGYYTSRPFFKRFDRLLDSLLRSTEILYSVAFLQNLAVASSSDIRQKLEYVRQNLALFQHHDAITGTSRDVVVNDYSQRMHRSLVFSHTVMEEILKEVYRTKKSSKTNFQFLHIFPDKDSLPQNKVLGVEDNGQVFLVVFNSLTHSRQETICFETSLNTSGCSVVDESGSSLPVQTSFLWNEVEIITDRIETCFTTELKPLSLTTFTIQGRSKTDEEAFSHTSLYNFNSISVPDNEYVSKVITEEDIVLESDILRVVIDEKTGMIKKVMQLDEFGLTQTHDFNVGFITYGTVAGKKDVTKSGAYLFMPDSQEAKAIPFSKPEIIVTKGPLFSRIEIIFKEPMKLKHVITVMNGEPFLRIDNEFHLIKGSYISNKEFVMRLQSKIENKNVFYTDLNGLQMTRRQRLDKIPFQGNVYPIPTLGYIEDSITRLYVISGQPLGGISPKEGVFDVFQDRRLLQDDNRGLGQGVTDNRRTRLSFKIMFEIKPMNDLKPSLKASNELFKLLHPALLFQTKEETVDNMSFLSQSFPCDVHLLNLRTSLFRKKVFITLQRFGVSCGTGCDSTTAFNIGHHVSPSLLQRVYPTMSRMTLSTLYEQKSNISILEKVFMDQMDLATYALYPV